MERGGGRNCALRGFEKAKHVAQEGIDDLVTVALEEDIRIILEECEEYNMPPGEMRIVTAVNDTIECEDEIDSQVDECKHNAENGSASALLGWAACNIRGFIDDLVACGGRVNRSLHPLNCVSPDTSVNSLSSASLLARKMNLNQQVIGTMPDEWGHPLQFDKR